MRKLRNHFLSLALLLLITTTAGCSSTSETINSQQQTSSSKTTQVPVQATPKNTGNTTTPYAPLHETFDQGINGAALQAATGIDME